MVTVKKCCCGCSLRAGCFILFWLGWLVCIIMSVRYSQILFEDPFLQTSYNVPASCFAYFFVFNIIGAISFSQGLHGLYMNWSVYLNCSYYYFCYSSTLSIAVVILLLFNSDKFVPFVQSSMLIKEPHGQILWMIATLFNSAANMYFTIVVKSLRDGMTELQYLSI